MKLKKLYMVRHGETDKNKNKILISNSSEQLNRKGIAQAKLASDYFKNLQIDAIFSSPQTRAVETVKIISESVNINFSVHAELEERDYGSFDGLHLDRLIEKRIKNGVSAIDPTQNWYGIKDVESDDKVSSRVHGFLNKLSVGENIIVVTHAGVIKSFLHSIYEIPKQKPNCFKIPNGSIVLLIYKNNQFELNELRPNDYL